MGDFEQNSKLTATTTEEPEGDPVVKWEHGSGGGSWQGSAPSVVSRTAHLYDSKEMSDITILSVDENWWFGATVKDFNGHKFLLGTASPVLNKLLYEWDNIGDDSSGDSSTERRLSLDPRLEVTITLSKSYFSDKIEWEGIPPIAAEALLEYIYKDKFNEDDFANGYSRNLLWRLWHASKAFEMDHLSDLCSRTLDRTMCQDTVFWDLNYSMKYKGLVSPAIHARVLKIIEEMEEKVFEHDDFVWLDHGAVLEILRKRKEASCEPMTVYNNLLRWSLYQLDRNACSEIDDRTGNDIPIEERLDWIRKCRQGEFDDHLDRADLVKYLDRGLEEMPWCEMSQSDFLKYVVTVGQMMADDKMLRTATAIMDVVVKNPERLFKSAHQIQTDLKAAKAVAGLKPLKAATTTALSNESTNKITSLFSRRNTISRPFATASSATTTNKLEQPLVRKTETIQETSILETEAVQTESQTNRSLDNNNAIVTIGA